MLKRKLSILAIASLGLSPTLHADCVTEAMTAMPYFDASKGELVMPLVELGATPSGDAEFLATRLQYQANSNPIRFKLNTHLDNPGSDCEDVSIPLPVFDMDTQELSIPSLALPKGVDEVSFHSAKLALQGGFLVLVAGSLEDAEGRYSGVVYNQETQQPLKDANVSLNGVASEQPTNGAGHFTITGIGNSICQTLTINGAGFAPVVKEVDIRFGGLTACTSKAGE